MLNLYKKRLFKEFFLNMGKKIFLKSSSYEEIFYEFDLNLRCV